MIYTALNTLEKAELVQLTKPAGTRNRYEGFLLLNEVGTRRKADPLQYVVPTASDNPVALPVEFITNGWLHSLHQAGPPHTDRKQVSRLRLTRRSLPRFAAPGTGSLSPSLMMS